MTTPSKGKTDMLIDKMHEMYKNDVVTEDVMAALEAAVKKAGEQGRDIDKNRLLEFADFYLYQIEKELGLPSEGSFSERRAAVKVKLLTRGEVSLEGAGHICDEYIKWHRFTYSAEGRSLMVEVGEDEAKEIIAGLMKVLEDYLPAHILIGYKYFIRMHKEVGEYTHGHLRKFTHAELRKRTILK